MKRVFLLVFCMLGMVFNSVAQNPAPSNEELKIQRAASLEQMTAAAKEAGAAAKEIEKLTIVFENLFKKTDAIKADATLTPEAKKEQLKAANAEKDWKVKNVLGDKYTAYSEARKRMVAAAAAAGKKQ
jgi:hypothetical protein